MCVVCQSIKVDGVMCLCMYDSVRVRDIKCMCKRVYLWMSVYVNAGYSKYVFVCDGDATVCL